MNRLEGDASRVRYFVRLCWRINDERTYRISVVQRGTIVLQINRWQHFDTPTIRNDVGLRAILIITSML